MQKIYFILKKILAIPLSILCYFFFFLNLAIFHPIQWISLKLGGYKAHKISVEVFNLFLMRSLNILGTRFSFDNQYQIPLDRPCIFVSNHQGLYDIPPIIWFLREHHPKFVSKKELGKGVPSISFNLRHGGSVLIDRKDPRKAIVALTGFAEYLNKSKHSAVIFPEGTRSRDGKPKKFSVMGLQILIKKMPEAMIVPLTINNSWKLFEYGKFPLGIGVHMKLKVHQPIPANSGIVSDLIEKVEQTIIADIE